MRGRRPMLLERQDELEVLAEATRAVAAGSGGVVVIQAPAGFGKTRLLAAVAQDAARRGIGVVRAAGSELGAAVPFALTQELVAGALDATAPAERDAVRWGRAAPAAALLDATDASGPGSAAETVLAAAWLLDAAAAQQPLLVAVDDAHWADPLSVDLLAHLAPRAEESGLLLVVAARPPATPADADPIGRLDRCGGPLLRPGPLSQDAVATLLADRLGRRVAPEFARAAQAITGGSPLHVDELAGALADHAVAPTAEGVDRLHALGAAALAEGLRRRLAQLPPECVAVARALAVLGDGEGAAVIARVAGIEHDAAVAHLAVLARADLVRDVSPPAYRHAVVRDAILSGLTAAERADWQRRAAAALRAHGAAPERVAVHLLASEPAADWEADVLRAAAAVARARGSPSQSARLLRRALQAPVAAELRPVLTRELGKAAFEAGEDGALDGLLAAHDVAADRTERARVALALAHPLAGAGRVGDAVDRLRRATAALGEDEPELRAELDATLAGIGLIDAGVAAEVVAELLPRVGDAPAGPAERRMLASLAQCVAMTGAPADTAAALAERAVSGGRLVAEAGPASLAVVWATLVLIAADRFALADEQLDRALDEARRRGSVAGFVTMSMMRSLSAYRQGALRDAEAEARSATDVALGHGWGTGLPVTTDFLIDALIERGELDAADQALERAGIGDELPDTIPVQAYLVARGRLHLARGRLAAGLADLLEVGRRAQGEGWSATIGTPTFRTYAVPALLALGDADTARRLADEEVALAQAWGAPRSVGTALRVQGLARGGAAGLELLEAAVATLGHAPLERARALVDLGAALRRAGRASAARTPLREAIDLGDACSAAPLVAFARDELAATGARRTDRTLLRGVDALTPSERRVGELAATGQTNREIAQELFLSRKTIEMHLSRVYRKLGVDSRIALARALRDEG